MKNSIKDREPTTEIYLVHFLTSEWLMISKHALSRFLLKRKKLRFKNLISFLDWKWNDKFKAVRSFKISSLCYKMKLKLSYILNLNFNFLLKIELKIIQFCFQIIRYVSYYEFKIPLNLSVRFLISIRFL